MNDAFGLKDTLTEIFTGMTGFVVEMIPKLVTGIVVLLIGVVIAKIIAKLLQTTFLRLKIDAGLEKLGITQMMQSIGVSGSVSETAVKLVYWLIVILFLKSAATSVGLVTVSDAIDSFFGYLPNLIAATLVLLFGNVVAQFAGGAVRRSAAESGVDYAPALGRAVTAGIIFIVAIMAITQLGIDTEMIRTVVVIGLAGGSLALALSFGLGTREVTKNLMAGFYARKLFRIGEAVEMSGSRGTLTAITATQTLLDVEGRTVSVPNRVFLDETVRQ